MATLRLILADQLSHSLASLQDYDLENDWVLMAEVRTEASYVKHHKKKIAFLFSAMRHFAKELTDHGHKLVYRQYDDKHNQGSLKAEVELLCKKQSIDRIVLTHPGEYRVLADMKTWQDNLGIEVEIREDDRFLASLSEFADWAKDRKQLRMEFFYREMRKAWHFLMDGDKPVGDKWNYDSANRKALPKDMSPPKPTMFEPDSITQDVIKLVSTEFADHFGELDKFHFAVTREQALVVLQEFIEQRLINFGDYQDAMVEGEPWMYHSHISFYLNCGLLTPKEVIEQAEYAYRKGDAPLNATEGFIRQVLGWREYVRGLYWLKMPGYKDENFLEAKGSLPKFFWDTHTQMNCLHQCIKETSENAYAHHIQRLMIIGNFALLAGLHPDEVNEWYLIVYADAYEWVEMPNVTGMILFADGGLLASKPYAASGSYINKMSNYCQNCHYSVKEKNGAQACPFNYLYWDFLDRNKEKLGNNPRLGMPYRTLNNMSDEKRQTIQRDSQVFFKALEQDEKV
ncbi:cryptochrome/photolyase family protein [Paraglaciecola arctica]|uniref:cryptochrome/photolyase family protein n=1 Tax=Paraglaciecola arctica TaxID=1128911 RepID=UPI001C07B365|nr:cryptochrome/photolyase family protein [Paraglaciecola arctica]MBU3004530.1 cryptochrome/photolyase family protein [Paraglaciecola arctica]